MTHLILAGLAAAVMLAYVCRVDDLSWRREPYLMLAHSAGGTVAAWVVSVAAVGDAGALHVAALAADAVALALLFRHLPDRRPPASAPIPAPPEAMRHVAGGSKDSG